MDSKATCMESVTAACVSSGRTTYDISPGCIIDIAPCGQSHTLARLPIYEEVAQWWSVECLLEQLIFEITGRTKINCLEIVGRWILVDILYDCCDCDCRTLSSRAKKVQNPTRTSNHRIFRCPWIAQHSPPPPSRIHDPRLHLTGFSHLGQRRQFSRT